MAWQHCFSWIQLQGCPAFVHYMLCHSKLHEVPAARLGLLIEAADSRH